MVYKSESLALIALEYFCHRDEGDQNISLMNDSKILTSQELERWLSG